MIPAIRTMLLPVVPNWKEILLDVQNQRILSVEGAQEDVAYLKDRIERINAGVRALRELLEKKIPEVYPADTSVTGNTLKQGLIGLLEDIIGADPKLQDPSKRFLKDSVVTDLKMSFVATNGSADITRISEYKGKLDTTLTGLKYCALHLPRHLSDAQEKEKKMEGQQRTKKTYKVVEVSHGWYEFKDNPILTKNLILFRTTVVFLSAIALSSYLLSFIRLSVISRTFVTALLSLLPSLIGSYFFYQYDTERTEGVAADYIIEEYRKEAQNHLFTMLKQDSRGGLECKGRVHQAYAIHQAYAPHEVAKKWRQCNRAVDQAIIGEWKEEWNRKNPQDATQVKKGSENPVTSKPAT